MPKMQFTQKGVEAVTRVTPKARTDYTDTATRGLTLRVGPRGASWYFLRRIDGRLVRVKIGDWPGVGIAKAREQVATIQDQVDQGKHPTAVQARQRSEKQHARAVDQARVFEKVVEAWQEHHLPGLADQTQTMYRRACRRLVDEFKGRDIGTIKRGELVRFLDGLKAASGSGVPANHAAATIRLIFGYAADRLELEANPAAGSRIRPRSRAATAC